MANTQQPIAELLLVPGALTAAEILVLSTLIETLARTSAAVGSVSPAVIQAIEDAIASLKPQAAKAFEEVVASETRKAQEKNRKERNRNVQ